MDSKKRNKAICPIEFEESPGKLVSGPIDFVAKPVYFVAHIKDKEGRLEECPVNNPLLGGTILPEGISIEQFEQFYQKIVNNNVIDGKEDDNSTNIKEVTTESTKLIKPKREVDELTNYELKPLCRRVFMNRYGTIDFERNEMVVQILIKEKYKTRQDTFLIKCQELDRLTKIIGKKYPSAIIYDKKNAVTVENDFREKSSQIQDIICYTDAGWQILFGKHVFLHKNLKLSNAEIMTPLGLPSMDVKSKKDIVDLWRKSLSLYKDFDVAAVLIVYSFLGVTYKLFDEAGFAPHFLLFINGKTGSFKTAIAKVLYTQLADEQHREFPRRIDADTQTSFERALVLSGHDTVTLIDDYSPAKSLQKENDMKNNLESIIRMVGDGSTKSRSNKNLDDCRGEGVKGVVTLTGELKSKGLSSNLRCLYCEIERELVNIEVLTWFQEKKYAYNTLIQHFANYLSDDWINIVSYIKEKFEIERHVAEKYIGERRLVDTLVTLRLMADIIGFFLINYCTVNQLEVSNEVKLLKEDMFGIVQRSEMISNEENPAKMFMKEVVNMIDNNCIYIKSERLAPIDLKSFDGFMDDMYFYLLPDNLYSKVISQLKRGGLYLGIDKNQLGGLLCNEGYAVSTPNGTNKKLYYARIDVGDGRKVKFLKIPRMVIEKLHETKGLSD